ncbi:MAG: cell division protein ZapA [Deltaproteobacteria bacterium]|nr:cell division protein ZapA [Deltaproteobacteria bacterium]
MSEKKSVTVDIKGQQYTIKTDVDEEHVLSVARLVNEQLSKIEQKMLTVSTVNLMVLALMNVASDYLQARNELEALTDRLEQLNNLFSAP